MVTAVKRCSHLLKLMLRTIKATGNTHEMKKDASPGGYHTKLILKNTLHHTLNNNSTHPKTFHLRIEGGYHKNNCPIVGYCQ